MNVKKIECCGLILFICLIVNQSAFAQEVDSLKTENLKEFVVQAEYQKTSAQKSTFTPTFTQKKTAQDAIDLLRQIALPQININLMSNAITTTTGANVALYIDYMPASKEEVSGLLTTDVRRVEYLDFPSDPRFQGNDHVIHFIMQKYEYGGYTKLSISENLLTGLSSKVSVFSKFVYKKMTYDLYVGSNNSDLRHIGASSIGKYTLSKNGISDIVTRKELFEDSHYKENEIPVTFRAYYRDDKMLIANTLGFSYDNIVHANSSGSLNYEPTLGTGYVFYRDNPSRRKYLIWNGTYSFTLTPSLRLGIYPNATIGYISDNTSYSTNRPGAVMVENNAKENNQQFGVSTTLYKEFTSNKSLSFSAFGGVKKNNVEYFGTSPYTNNFSDRFAGAMLGYNYSNGKWNLSTDLAVQWEENTINNSSIREVYPLFNITAGYSPNSKHSFNSYFHYGANYPSASEKSPNVLMVNEMMYKTGNPNMGLSRQFTLNLSYNWMPNNNLSASLYGQYYGEIGLYVPIYAAYNDGKALLRNYVTDSQYHRTKVGLSVNYKLIDGKLQLAASPSFTFFRVLGTYNIAKSPFNCNASATYYLGDFYLQGAYQTKFRTIQGNRAVYYEDRDFYQLLVGWNKNNFNVRMSLNNMFRGDWRTSRELFESPLYSETRIVEGTGFHRRINISMTYTFGYGKKVKYSNEIGQQYGGNSAILK